MINWPCILKFDGDAELMFLSSETQLANELDALIWDSSDRLIDSRGQCYLVSFSDGSYRFDVEGNVLSLDAVTQLIREHEFSKAEMCLTKIQFPSIEKAIMSLATEKQT